MVTRHAKLGGCKVGAVPPHATRRKVGRSAVKPLPPKVDLRPFLTQVEEQVGMSCVANTYAGAYEYLAKRNLGSSSDVSRLFIYYNARAESDSQDDDDGTSMVDAIEGLKRYGACREDLWPNDEDVINEEPSEEAYTHGAHFKIADAEYVETALDLWKHTLADGYPIAFCLNTFSSFDNATNSRGRVPMPKSSEQEREEHGWHAMLCVGYLEKDQLFIVRNSWGTEWGDRGYCYIPYKYVMHETLNGHDSWVVKSVEDLDFSQEIESEDDSSYFAEEGSIQLFDFYVATEDVEDFATALDELCTEYATDEDYYFDYEETEEDGTTYAEMSNFDITLEDAEGFLEALDALCDEWAEDEDYDYSVEGVDGSAEDSEDDEAADENDDEASEEDILTLTDFYIYTENSEQVVDKIDKLCAKHSQESEHYEYDWQEEEDEDGTYVSFTRFEIIPDDEDAFLAALEALCEKLAEDGGYDWE
jgi:hypothetical protein